MKSSLFPLNYPCLIYYIGPNPHFGKQYTLADIPEMTQEYYDYYCADCATLGRQVLSFEEASTKSRQYDLRSKIQDALCPKEINKFTVDSDADLIVKLKKCDNSYRFTEPTVQAYFLAMLK